MDDYTDGYAGSRRSEVIPHKEDAAQNPSPATTETEFCSWLMPLGSKTCHHCKKPVKVNQSQDPARSRDWRPFFTTDNVTNMSTITIVNESQRSQSVASGVPKSNLRHVVLAEHLFAVVPSTFASHVPRVVLIGSEKQMIGANARRVIATVKNAKTFWDWAVMDLPRQSMRAVSHNALALAMTDDAVPKSVGARSPQPARLGLVDSLPKAIRQWYFSCSHDLNLTDRLGLWSGSRGGPTHFAGRLYFNTTGEWL